MKLDDEKLRFDLVPISPMREVVRVLTLGARKYADDNWQVVPDPRRRYYAATMRHLDRWWGGETRDPELGTHHLANATCCLLFLMWFDLEDNRSVGQAGKRGGEPDRDGGSGDQADARADRDPRPR